MHDIPNGTFIVAVVRVIERGLGALIVLALLPFTAHADDPAPAQATIRVQAYWFTSRPILRALAAARKRGLDVAVILDRSQDRRQASGASYTAATYLTNAGIPVFIDPAPGIAHNKVIVLDGAIVVTGSFNFTTAADTRNVENVVVLQSAEVAGWYAAAWERRRAVSRAFGAE